MSTSGVKQHLRAIAALAASVVILYAGTLHAPFLYDDEHAALHNPYVRDLRVFWEDVARHILGSFWNRPLLLFSFALNHELGGEQVAGYRLLNILAHALNCVTLYFLAREMLPPAAARSRLPLCAALFHAANPLAAQTVIYISNRSSLLATWFYLLGFLAFARYLNHAAADNGKRTPRHLPLLFALAFILGAAVKEEILTLPLLAILYGFLRYAGGPERVRRQLAAACMAALTLGVLYAGARLLAGAAFLPDPSYYRQQGLAYFMTQWEVIVFYYGLKAFLPINLNFEPDVRLAEGLGGQGALALAVLCGVAVYALRCRKAPFLARFGLLWAVLTLAPTSSLAPLKQIAAEHRAYLPGIGVSLWLSVMLFTRRGQRAALLAAVYFAACMSALTIARGGDFRSEIAVWQDTVRKSPGKTLAHNNLAAALTAAKRYDEAIAELGAVTRMDPFFTSAYINLGNIYFERKQYEQAQKQFDQAVQYGSKDRHAHYNAGLARLMQGRALEALPYFQRALSGDPENPEFHFALGNVYKQLKWHDQALSAYREALARQPQNPEAHNNMGAVFWELKMLPRAEEEFKKALAQDGRHAESLRNLAGVYMLENRYREAVAGFDAYLSLHPEDENARALREIAAARAAPPP